MKKKIIIPLIAAAIIPGTAIAQEKIDDSVLNAYIASQMTYADVSSYRSDIGFGFISFKGELKNNNKESYLQTRISKENFEKESEEIVIIKDYGLDNLTDEDEILYGMDYHNSSGDIVFTKRYFKELSTEAQDDLREKYTKIIESAPKELKETHESFKEKKQKTQRDYTKEFEEDLKNFFD